MSADQLIANRKVFKWSNLRLLLDQNLVRLAVFAPLLGYIILFNDTITDQFEFENLIGSNSTLFLSTKSRLQLIYFGTILCSACAIWYKIRCPEQIRLAANSRDYSVRALQDYSVQKLFKIFVTLEMKVGYGLHDYTLFDRDDLHEFLNEAIGGAAQTNTLTNDEIQFTLKDTRNPHDAVTRSREFLGQLLEDEYKYIDHSRKIEITTLAILTVFSLGMLAIPAADVFFSVIFDIFQSDAVTPI